MHESIRQDLLQLFMDGVEAVKGKPATQAAIVARAIKKPTHVLSVGKAAVSMFEGLPREWRESVPTLLVTKTGHIGATEFTRNVHAIEASHPVPDDRSLRAGAQAVDFVTTTTSDDRLLVLVSGGASALVEHLKNGITKKHLTELTGNALSDGTDIKEINRQRLEISAIKGGQLLECFRGSHIDVLAISDVPGDDINIIGSGIGAKPATSSATYECHIIASNAVARNAVATSAKALGLKVISNTESMYKDVSDLAEDISRDITSGPDGLYICGGEPTIVLPAKPGRGGRNQALALELAKRASGVSTVVGLVAGTDGTDGPTSAAGGFFDGSSVQNLAAAQRALERADSGTYLASCGDQVETGPTGTNVMDLALIYKLGD